MFFELDHIRNLRFDSLDVRFEYLDYFLHCLLYFLNLLIPQLLDVALIRVLLRLYYLDLVYFIGLVAKFDLYLVI